jgi:adenylyl-sulfate kinase
MHRHTYLLDGDNVRHGLCSDLKFSVGDRVENIRRIGELGKLFLDAGIITLCAFISPFISDRKIVRELLSSYEFIEVYMNTSLEECERRDPKGLYRKARAGDIKLFTGIDSPYEPPTDPEIHLNGDRYSAEQLASQITDYLQTNDYLSNK